MRTGGILTVSWKYDLWGNQVDDEPEPSGDLLEDESYFPPDPETIDQKMFRLTGELLPPADNRPLDSWPRVRCFGCRRSRSAAFNRAANYYICFAPDCEYSSGVGVGGDNSPTRMFRTQINTAVRRLLGVKGWGDWIKVLRRDIWAQACELVLNYAYGEPNGPNDAGVLATWFQDLGGDLDKVSARVYTALYGDLRNWARAQR
jgi:hypothetical protein